MIFALDRFDREPTRDLPRRAVDLGCGSGRDTVEMLRRGWRVLAIDAEASAIEGLQARPDLPRRALLDTEVARFEVTTWPRAELVNAAFALPLCPASRFPGLWRNIVDSLASGGRFSGQLYGDRDGWAGDSTITFLARDEAEALFDDFEIERFHEEEEDSITPRGRAKHWHIFHVVARKP